MLSLHREKRSACNVEFGHGATSTTRYAERDQPSPPLPLIEVMIIKILRVREIPHELWRAARRRVFHQEPPGRAELYDALEFTHQIISRTIPACNDLVSQS